MKNIKFLQKQALILMQSLLGVISPNFRMVYITYANKFFINIILEKAIINDFEEIKDCEYEFGILQMEKIDYEFNISITEDNIDWPDELSIVLYKRREESLVES